jgi:hypothetical protein
MVWSQFRGKFPDVSVRDMVIQERENDLVIATHGRGIFIIDDITPLRQLSEEVLQQDLAFLDSRPYKVGHLGWEMGLTGDDEFVGSNPPGSSIITYYLKKRHIFGDMFIEIFNEEGEKVKELPAGKRKGINRVNWYMRMKPPKVPVSPLLAARSLFGPTYPPGEYMVKIVKGDKAYEGKISVVYDETIPHTIADRNKRQEVLMEAYHLLENLAFLDKQVTDIRDQARKKSAIANNKSLGKRLTSLANKMDATHKELAATTVTSEITGEEKLREKIGVVYGAILDYQGRPSQTQIDRLNDLTKEVETIRKSVDKVMAEELPELEKLMAKEDIEGFSITTLEEFLEEEAED